MDEYRTTDYCRMPQQGSLVDRSLDLRLQSVQMEYYFKWSCINLLLLVVLCLDIFVMEGSSCLRYRLVYIGSIFLAFSFLACFTKYLQLAFEYEPGVGTGDQKRLLDGTDEGGVDTILDLPDMEPPSDCKEDDAPIACRSSSFIRPCALRNRGSNQNLCQQPSQKLLVENRIPCPEDFLTDPRQLPALIWRAKRERKLLEEGLRSPKVQSSSCREITQRLKNTTYKLSPPPVSNRPLSFQEFGTSHTQRSSSTSPRFSSVQMRQYVANLNSWMQETILKRLVREMDFVNNVLQQRGFVGFEIGTVDRDTLRRTVEGQWIMMPVLPTVLAFLNIPGDHRYLVQRIRELADSGSHSGNSGVRLPTDAAIIFHLFCVYLDTQLEPILGCEAAFTSRYVIQCEPKQPLKDILRSKKNCANFYFLVTNNEVQRRPRFDYICGGVLNRFPDQRGSPFQVIIEFLTHMRQHQDSTLEGVSLGRSGINIMWVIGESKAGVISTPKNLFC